MTITGNFLSFLIFRFLQHLVQPSNSLGLCMGADYRIALLCNAYSTNQEYFTRPMAALVETILGAQKSSSLPPGPTTPLSMAILDSLTVCLIQKNCSFFNETQHMIQHSYNNI